MQFFDLVAMRCDSLEGLAGRLGYKKIFCAGRDLDIVENLSASPRRKILRSDDFETITKALKQNDVIGVMPEGASVSNKTFDAIKNSEKILFIAFSPVTRAETGSRIQKLAKVRSLVRNTLRSKTPFAIITLAEDGSEIMSGAQMLEVAGFFGIPQKHAKEALHRLGGLL